MRERIAILGSGLVGSMWAVYLAKRGYQVDVYERRPDMRKANISAGRSINLALSARGWQALEKIGYAEEVNNFSIPMYGREIHDVEGNCVFQSYGLDEEAIYSVPRGGINKTMMSAAETHDGVKIHFNKRCSNVNLYEGTFDVEDLETGEKCSESYDRIFGADGAFSQVRASMVKTNRFSYSQTYLDHGYKELVIPPNEDGSWRIKKNALHIWPRRSFMLIALPNMDGSFTVTLFLAYEGENSLETLKTDAEVKAFFQKWFPDALEVMPTLIEDWHANPFASLATIKAKPWHVGKSCLIGDAAHAIVPFYGQGMNAGFEDCFVYDEILERNDGDWDKAFEEISRNRVKDGHAIADLAIQNFYEMRDHVADAEFLRRKKISKYLVEHYPSKYRPQYDLVTFTHTPYSEALAFGPKQAELLNKITLIADIDSRLASGPVKEAEEILNAN